ARPLADVPVTSDLTYRAAQLLQSHAGITSGVTITTDKRIPLGSGMGGGSSDAASVLLALNRLWGLNLTRGELMRLGLTLGADVPFFIFGSNAHVSGIGELLRPVSLPRMTYLIEVPPVHVATAGVFAAPELARDTPVSNADAFGLDFGRNDLQPVTAAAHRAVATTLRALDLADFPSCGRSALSGARMSGSGAAVFRIIDRGFPVSEHGWRAMGDRRRDDWKFLQSLHYRSPKSHGADGKPVAGSEVICARGIHRHPLREFAAK
ncbi:MAG: 4-(cytidine 5'-diphospho)-2-C-methyl-D-erythritol kinase, partial [Betaproteobacteria bacterium]